MKNPPTSAIRIGAMVGTIALALIAPPFSIPAILLAVFRRGEYPRCVGSLLALIAVLVIRVVTGQWIVYTVGVSSGQWFVELAQGLFAWALGAILIAVTFRLTAITLNQSNHCTKAAPP